MQTEYLLHAKGAPDVLLHLCSRINIEGEQKELDDEHKEEFQVRRI